MRKLLSVLLVAVMVFALCSFSANADGSEAESAPADGEKLTIAFSAGAYSIAVLPQYLVDTFNEMCGEEGWEFLMLAAEGDADLQTEQITTLIAKKPDYLVIFPCDPMLAADYCQQAADEGIDALAVHVDFDESCHGTTCKAYCGIDNDAVATAIYDYMTEACPDGANIVEIAGVPIQADYIARTGTFNSLCEDTEYKQLGEIAWAYSSRADAQGYMERFLGTYGDDIDVLVGFDDDLTLGGVNALQEAGRDDVKVFSITGQKDAMQAIKDGTMTMTVFTSITKEAEMLVDVIKQLEAGEEVDYYHYIDIEVVDINNVDDFIDLAEF